MKKLSFLVVGLLIISSFAAIGFSKEASAKEQFSLNFSTPEIVEKTIQGENYIELEMEGTNGVLHHAGEPLVPFYSETIELPFGTKITDLHFEISEVKTMSISEKITPAPQPMVYDMDYSVPEYSMNEEIYSSSNLYPDTWATYYTGGGLNGDDVRKTFLTIRAFPARYSPTANEISYVESMDLVVSFDTPERNPVPTKDAYDLVIITPSKLYDNSLESLKDHKNSYGMRTTIKLLRDIYSEYSGADESEQIKYFIKDAIETWGIKYVLLIGGLDSYINARPRDGVNQGVSDWNLPVRYTNNRQGGGTNDPGVLCDLYLADIYDSEGAFNSWDSSGDGVFAGWSFRLDKDILDMYPDVHVGRLACRNVWEVKIMTNKIMNYEATAYGTDWYNKLILVGGDSFNDAGTDYLEGEVVADRVANDFLTDFDPIRVYASYRTSNPQYTPTPDNIIRVYSQGAGHIFFDGHSYPVGWNTHWPGEFDSWIGSFSIFLFYRLKNGEQLPICAVEGCHNSQFNVSIIPTLMDPDNDQNMWCHGMPTPECWSWWMTRKVGGGSIATIGNTGLGMGAVGEHGDLDNDGVLEADILEALGGFWFSAFYETFAEGAEYLGELWTGAMSKYQDTFPAMEDSTDAQICQQLALLGDPSLKMGGYPPSNDLTAGIYSAGAGIEAGLGDSVHLRAYAKNGASPYTFEWDFDEDEVYDDATGQTVTYNCNKVGVYVVKLKVTDSESNTDTYSTIIAVDPSSTKPDQPKGSLQVAKNKDYTYTATIDTLSWEEIHYKFSWGDGKESEWVDTNKATHRWSTEGTYQIKVKAMVSGGSGVTETDWSNPLTISVSKSKTRDKPLVTFLQRLAERFPVFDRLLELPIFN